MEAQRHQACFPHGKIEQVLNDLFVVRGSVEMAPEVRISRNMTIIRRGSELTLVSAVRLDDRGLEKLERLGRVKHVVKLGAYHLGQHNGLDDAFYVNRYQALLWALPGMTHANGLTTDRVLSEAELPVSEARLFQFHSSAMPEALLILAQQGGVVISADSLQNWGEVDEFFSDTAAEVMQKGGFIQPANIGPEWRRRNQPDPAEFHCLKEEDFQHLLPSHGAPLLTTAKAQICATIDRLYPVESGVSGN